MSVARIANRPFRTTAIPPQNQERRAAEEVGQPPRHDLARLDRDTFAFEKQAGQERRTDPAMHGLHDLVEPLFRFDQLACAAASLGQPAQKRFIDGLIDAQRENANALEISSQRREDLVLVADLAVGDQNQNAVPFFGRYLGEELDGPVERAGHLGAAPGAKPARYSTARNRLRSVAAASPSASPGGVSITLSKAKTQNRSESFSVSIIRAMARRAATIFQPSMLPDRSSTNATARGRELPPADSSGGTIVRANVPAPGSRHQDARSGSTGSSHRPAETAR